MLIHRRNAHMRIIYKVFMGSGTIDIQKIDLAVICNLNNTFTGIMRIAVLIYCRDNDKSLALKEMYYVFG